MSFRDDLDARGMDYKFTRHHVALKCTCYRATEAGPRRVKFYGTPAEGISWLREHQCEFKSLDAATVECVRLSVVRKSEIEAARDERDGKPCKVTGMRGCAQDCCRDKNPEAWQWRQDWITQQMEKLGQTPLA